MPTEHVWCLAETVILLGGYCQPRILERAWRLAVCDFRQAVWNNVVPGDAGVAPSDSSCKVESRWRIFTALDKGFERMTC